VKLFGNTQENILVVTVSYTKNFCIASAMPKELL